MSADGENVVGHAGARLLSDLADELGLTEAFVGGDGIDQAALPSP